MVKTQAPRQIVKPIKLGKKSKTNVRRALRAARDLIAGKPGTLWIKGDWIQTRTDEETGAPLACFCAEGAVQAVVQGVGPNPFAPDRFAFGQASDEVHQTVQETFEALRAVLPRRWGGSIYQFNDAQSRTRKQVVALFDKALENLDGEAA